MDVLATYLLIHRRTYKCSLDQHSQAWPDPRGKTEGQGKYVYQTCSTAKFLQ